MGLFTFCKMIDLPHFEGGTYKAYNPEIQAQTRFLYKACTHHV